MLRKSLTLISILSFLVNLIILPEIAYGNDFLNYTIPAPLVQADLIGEDNDTFSVRVSWILPEDLEADAYGFVVEKEGPNGRKVAAIYYPSSQGFYDTTDNGYYQDEAVVPRDTYTYYVKAYDRSGKESDYSQTTIIIPDSTLPPLAIQNVQVTPQGDQSLTIQYDITQSAYNYLIFNGTKYGDGATAGTHSSITVPATGLTPETEYSYSIKAYPNKDNENGAVTSDGKYVWNPCGLGMITSNQNIVYLKVPLIYEMTFNGQAYTSTTKPPSSSPSYGYYVSIDNLTPAASYDYTVKTCGGMRQAVTSVYLDLQQIASTTSSATISWSSVSIAGEASYKQVCTLADDPLCDSKVSTVPLTNPLTIGGLKPNRTYEVTVTAKIGKYSFTAGAINAHTKLSIDLPPSFCPSKYEVKATTSYGYTSYSYVYTYDFGDVSNYNGKIVIGNYTWNSSSQTYDFSGTNIDLISPYTYSTTRNDFDNYYRTHYVYMSKKDDPIDGNTAQIYDTCSASPSALTDTPPSSASSPSASTDVGPANLATYYLPQEVKQDDSEGSIAYTTTLPVTTEVEYSVSSKNYTQTMNITGSKDKTTFHTAKIPNLKARTYHYRVVSTDAQGKKYYSEEKTLKYGNRYSRFFGDMWEWTRFALSKKTLNEGLSNSKYFLGNTWNRTASTFR